MRSPLSTLFAHQSKSTVLCLVPAQMLYAHVVWLLVRQHSVHEASTVDILLWSPIIPRVFTEMQVRENSLPRMHQYVLSRQFHELRVDTRF